MAPCPGCPRAVPAGELTAQGPATWAGGGGFPLGQRAPGLGWTMKIIKGWPTQTPGAVPGTQKAGAQTEQLGPPRVACSPVAGRGGGEERCSGPRVGSFGPLEQEESWLLRRRARSGSAGGAELFGFETIPRGAKRQTGTSEVVTVQITVPAPARRPFDSPPGRPASGL